MEILNLLLKHVNDIFRKIFRNNKINYGTPISNFLDHFMKIVISLGLIVVYKQYTKPIICDVSISSKTLQQFSNVTVSCVKYQSLTHSRQFHISGPGNSYWLYYLRFDMRRHE